MTARDQLHEDNPRRYAPTGKHWQCGCCGKRAEYDSYGLEGRYSYGWDESCALNSVLVEGEMP